MKIRTLIVVDNEDGSEPTRHEVWREISKAERREYQYPQRPHFEMMNHFERPVAMMEYQRDLDRHNKYVEMISHEIALALGRALGNKPEHG